MLYNNGPTIALQKSPCASLVRLPKDSCILPERLRQITLHQGCPRQRGKCIFRHSGHTIETRLFKCEHINRLSISCVSRSLETGMSIHGVSRYAFKYQLKPWNSHQNATLDNLLACYGAAENMPYLTVQEAKRDLTALCRRCGPAACSIHSCGPTMMSGRRDLSLFISTL